MTGVYLIARALHADSWQAFTLAPVHDWALAWHATQAGDLVRAFVLCAPVAVPAGLAVAAVMWAWRIYTVETGLSGRLATAPVVFDARQWRRQVRAARGRIAAPGTVPLADGRSRVVMGATIRAVGHRWQPVMAVPYTAMGRHQVVIGASGSGKTNLMIRSWAGWYAAALHATRTHGRPRPLLIVLDCKGGPDSRVKGRPGPPPAARGRCPPGRHLARRSRHLPVGAAGAGSGGGAVPDDRNRQRGCRLLR